jgi:polyferredoxin
VLRPRVVVYAALLTLLFGAWAWGILHRSTLTIEVLRDRNALYFVDSDGFLENSYTLKIVNKRDAAQRCTISVESEEHGLVLHGGELLATLPAGEVTPLAARVQGPATLRGRHEVEFLVHCGNGGDAHGAEARSSFFGPAP